MSPLIIDGMVTPEAYCLMCRRMVPARRGTSAPNVWILAEHYRFDLTRRGEAVPCRGVVTSSPVTFGQEDPKAAFRGGGPRAWGKIGKPRGMRFDEYVD